MKILIIEDEPAIADTLIYALESENFTCEWCKDGVSALKSLQNSFDLILLDIGLPDINGFDLLKKIRVLGSIPVLFLTARSEEIDRIIGLELGADDYIVKPFSPREVTARIRAVLRRSFPGIPPEKNEPLPTGLSKGLVIDQNEMAVYCNNAKLELTRYEFLLMKHLFHHPGRVFSRRQLMEAVWDEPESSQERTVDAHIKSLRNKLKKYPGFENCIQTSRGFGYSFRKND